MQEIMLNITSDRGMFTIAMIFGIGGLIALFGIFFGSITKATHVKEREKSRREIAAYIAEGSISAEDGERLLNAGNPKNSTDVAMARDAKYCSAT
ncbi:MAG: hypothetical protein CMJ35_04000 [Phycisphaerae bacterium]|nr:hypothetical protein [Phycisphaerae bacterium]|tara:strand:+ start:975 stop:1259 length:285 start_codon:yes stop_codon:yes gene_type:complete